jgi:thymidylate synthase
MRSNDIFYGFTYDVPFFATVMQTMWHNLKVVYPELKLGTYFHMADNIHYYERHFESADKILTEDHESNIPEFVFLKEPLFWIEADHLILTQNTIDFQEEIDSLVEQSNLTQETCKNALRKLFIFQ